MGFGIDFAVRIDPPKAGGKAGEVGEFFWDGAANTLFWVDPKNKLTAVLFTHTSPSARCRFIMNSAPLFTQASIPTRCRLSSRSFYRTCC